MPDKNSLRVELDHIKHMMSKSSKFTALPGFSPFFSGVIAILAFMLMIIKFGIPFLNNVYNLNYSSLRVQEFQTTALYIGCLTFLFAAGASFIFIAHKSKVRGIPLFTQLTLRVVISIAIPMLAGSIVILKLLLLHQLMLIIPLSLIFYGLGLIAGGRYTLKEVEVLGYLELLLGIMGLFTSYNIFFWLVGFGVFHIVIGMLIWYKHDRKFKNSK